jgi:ribosomal protein S18 acetylase RimI-like enzyme
MNHEVTKDTKKELQIRRGKPGDEKLLCNLAEAVQEIHLVARPDFFKPHTVTPEMMDEYKAQLTDVNTHVYIGEVNGEAIGYILAQFINRPENLYTYGKQFLHIDQMSVNPEHRSVGSGEQLMQQVFDLARSLGVQTVTLNVWAFNQRAIAFYERQGFTVRNMRMEAHLE